MILIDDNAIRPINRFIAHLRGRMARDASFDAVEIIGLAKQAEARVIADLAPEDRANARASITSQNTRNGHVAGSTVNMIRKPDGWHLTGYVRTEIPAKAPVNFDITPARDQSSSPDLIDLIERTKRIEHRPADHHAKASNLHR